MAIGPTIGTIRGTIEIDYDGNGIIRAEKAVDGFEKKTKRSFKELDGAARGLALFGGVIAGGFAVATASAVSFEKRMSAVAAVSSASADELKALSDKALQLGKDTAFSASEAAQAIEELVKAGLSVEDVLNGAADATVNLAAAGEISLPEAATIAANAMNQFGLAAEDLPKVVDQIAGAANASAIDVSQFGYSLSQVGAVAHLAGQSFEDTATAIALMGNAGIVGSDAGTSLKTFLANLVPTTLRAKEAFKDLGLNVGASGNAFIDAQGNYKSLSEIAGILNTATKDLSESQKQQALETIFGADAIRAAAVISEAGAEGFRELNAAMNESTAAEVAATRMDNAAGSIEELKGSVETLGITIGAKFTPTLQKVVDKVTAAVNSFGELDEGTQEVILTIIAAVGGLALMAAGFIKVVNFAARLVETVKIIKGLAATVKIISALTKVWTAIQWALNAAFVANPIGLIVLAVIALIAILVVLFKKNETFRKIVLAVWDAIKVAIGAVVDWLKNTAWPIIQAVWKGIVEGAKWLWGWIKKIWSAIVASIMFYVDILKKVWATIAPAVEAAFNLVVSIIKTAWTVISAIFSVFVAIMKVTVIPIFHALWLVVSTVFGAILAIVKAVWGFIEPYIVRSLQEVLAIVKAVWGFIGPYIVKWVQEVWAMIQKIWGLVVSATSTAFNTIWNVIKTVWDFIVNAVRNGVAIIVGVFNGIKAIVDKVRTFFGQLKAAADGGIGSLISFVKGIPKKILDAIGNLGKLLYNAGRNIIQGLIDGLKSMLSSLANTASNVMSTIRDYLPFSPAKKGPFSGKGWTLYSGQALITDFARGITMNAEVPQVALEGSLATVAASLDVSSAPVAPASTTGNAVPVAINVQGVWDFTDPSKTRVMVATLNDELTRYQKGYQ